MAVQPINADGCHRNRAKADSAQLSNSSTALRGLDRAWPAHPSCCAMKLK